jgi:hypothetical protein
MDDSSGNKRPAPKSAAGQAEVLERVGMKRWMRLTARKHSVGKATVNPAADAAADAIAQMLGKPKLGR